MTEQNKPEDNIDLSPEAVAAMQGGEAPEAAPANDEQQPSLEEEVGILKDQLLRALAEQENTRKRAEKSVSDARQYAVTGFAKDLLEVADNLKRALDAVPEEEREGNLLLEGVEATQRAMLAVFDRHGLKQVTPEKGKDMFDAHLHEAMFEAPAGEGQQAGLIIEVLEVGYTLNGRLIRPARVGVVK